MLQLSNQALQLTQNILQRRNPQAIAAVHGSPEYACIRGTVFFYQTEHGTLVLADISGLPNPSEPCKSPIFAFHIHSGGSCSGNAENPFADALGHYNPGDCLHPYHAGDLPPLFGCHGYAFSCFLTSRFAVREIIGRTIIIHANPDDFTTQPSGAAGKMIACGKIHNHI